MLMVRTLFRGQPDLNGDLSNEALDFLLNVTEIGDAEVPAPRCAKVAR